MAQRIALVLAAYAAGRILLHLAALVADHEVAFHLSGVARELH